MKVIVHISRDECREDVVEVYGYSYENFVKVVKIMGERWKGRKAFYGCFGDLPCEGGSQYGCDEKHYDSFSVVEVENEKQIQES